MFLCFTRTLLFVLGLVTLCFVYNIISLVVARDTEGYTRQRVSLPVLPTPSFDKTPHLISSEVKCLISTYYAGNF